MTKFSIKCGKGFTLPGVILVIGIIIMFVGATSSVYIQEERLKLLIREPIKAQLAANDNSEIKKDEQRIGDLEKIQQAIVNLQDSKPDVFIGYPNIVYVSLPDKNPLCGTYSLPELPAGWQYHCAIPANYQKTDGTGWIPVNFLKNLNVLPVDPVNVYRQNKTSRDDYFYAYAASRSGNTWDQIADFGGTARTSAVGFSIGDKGYVGTGYDGMSFRKDLWEYDPLRDTWTQKADFGGTARIGAVGFAAGGKGYVGTGEDGDGLTKDLWEYDPAANSWEEKAAIEGEARKGGFGFSIGKKGYVGTGFVSRNMYLNDFWEYDPVEDTWTQKADFTETARTSAVGFSIGKMGYAGLGTANGTTGMKDFWQYDPAKNIWAKAADFGGQERWGAVGFSIGSKGYIGTGYLGGKRTRDFWQYSPPLNYWFKKSDLNVEMAEAVGFSIGTQGYIGTGKINSGYSGDLWQYNSDSNFELNAKLQSDYYGFTNRDGFPVRNASQDDAPLADGGDSGLYEAGSDLTLIPDSAGLCPTGMVWVPSPARICIDKYQDSYATEAKKPDGSACQGRCPVSRYNASVWTDRASFPSIARDDKTSGAGAIQYCQNAGKELPTDFEWWLAAAGTPDPYDKKPARVAGSQGLEPCMLWSQSGAVSNHESRPEGSLADSGYDARFGYYSFIRTGTAKKCISLVGAMDMIGNVMEWTGDTVACSRSKCVYEGTDLPDKEKDGSYITSINDIGMPLTLDSVPSAQFNNDSYSLSASQDSLWGFLRNGAASADAGKFALRFDSPASSNFLYGFRCVFR